MKGPGSGGGDGGQAGMEEGGVAIREGLGLNGRAVPWAIDRRPDTPNSRGARRLIRWPSLAAPLHRSGAATPQRRLAAGGPSGRNYTKGG